LHAELGISPFSDRLRRGGCKWPKAKENNT